jgi:hypothetical protein
VVLLRFVSCLLVALALQQRVESSSFVCLCCSWVCSWGACCRCLFVVVVYCCCLRLSCCCCCSCVGASPVVLATVAAFAAACVAAGWLAGWLAHYGCAPVCVVVISIIIVVVVVIIVAIIIMPSSSWCHITSRRYPTVWASHHYGLLSGNTESTTVITAHSGNHWACGGSTAPGGEGYTGRGGKSSFRLWVR